MGAPMKAGGSYVLSKTIIQSFKIQNYTVTGVEGDSGYALEPSFLTLLRNPANDIEKL